MPTLHQYDYLFAFGVIFATLDSFMIGANDVANSWAPSVSSRSLTLRQAVLGAAVFEFLGAVLVGARTSSTIKNSIVPSSIFQDDAGLQLLSFVNAIFCSSVWLTIATKLQFPVSTTYSIVSAVAGVGIAVGGWDAPEWGWNDSKGLGAIFAGLVIAPALSAGFAAVIYAMVRFGVLSRKDSLRWALYTSPFWFFLATAVMTMAIIFKGSPTLNLDEMSSGKTAGAVLITALVISILSMIVWLPYVYCKTVRKDYTVRWYHFFMGPALWWRKAPADAGSVNAPRHVVDYRVRDRDQPEHFVDPKEEARRGSDSEASADASEGKRAIDSENGELETPAGASKLEETMVKNDPWKRPLEGSIGNKLWIIMRYWIYGTLTYGMTVDIHAMQGEESGWTGKGMAKIYATTRQFPNETEAAYSFVQVMTACVASFAHGANDLGNAIGPFSVIYYTWFNGEVAGSKSPVPVWMLAYGAITLCIGLAVWGWRIIVVLGNRITLLSPSRGFTISLGSAIVVILASQYGIPVSTTMCATGATLGVGIVGGSGLKSINWRALLWIYTGWIATIVIVCTFSACCLAIIINAPRLP